MRPKRCFFAMLAVGNFNGLEAVHGAKGVYQEATVPLHGFVYLGFDDGRLLEGGKGMVMVMGKASRLKDHRSQAGEVDASCQR